MSDMKFWYPASITQITSINDSFDSCILSICYAGKNRNKTTISKEAIENAIPTMSYCPIVANYDIGSDMIGGHDVGFAETSDGTLRMINLTDAIGVVPENPQWCWQKKTDEDGVEREYLSTPAILWKRTPVYEKLKRDGVSGQSMEINVKDGKVVDGLFEIESFEFTAFCLLGDNVEPCFEGAQIETFSIGNLSSRLGEMMEDFKTTFSKVIAASADDNITPSGDYNNLEGGEGSLNIEELLQKYGLVAEDVDFETDGMTVEEIEERFAALQTAKFAGESEGEDNEADPESDADDSGTPDDDESEQQDEPEDDDDDEEAPAGNRKQYSLTGEQMRDGILEALRTVRYTDEWGEWQRYCYVDYDVVANEVYAYDNEDWNLYGFKYSMNGDTVVIDFNSKTRKKVAFVDFEGNDQQFSYQHMMDTVNARFAVLADEVTSLRTFKQNTEDAERKVKENEVFSKFADLSEDERFKALREDCSGLSIQEIEDKCYAIRGRNIQMKFSNDAPTSIRLPVERWKNNADPDEPYGGIFKEFGLA